MAVLGTCVALTWLNPHVYLETVLLLGSLGYDARLLRPLFGRPGAWRALDVLVAATMTVIGVGLLT